MGVVFLHLILKSTQHCLLKFDIGFCARRSGVNPNVSTSRGNAACKKVGLQHEGHVIINVYNLRAKHTSGSAVYLTTYKENCLRSARRGTVLAV
jgi:hypothetical protein